MKTLGDRLKFVRKSKGYTQESLADAIGVSRGVIFNLEKNKTKSQKIVLVAICRILNVNIEWLETGHGNIKGAEELTDSAKILSELYDVVKNLSEREQLYLLDTIKALKIRLGNNKDA